MKTSFPWKLIFSQLIQDTRLKGSWNNEMTEQCLLVVSRDSGALLSKSHERSYFHCAIVAFIRITVKRVTSINQRETAKNEIPSLNHHSWRHSRDNTASSNMVSLTLSAVKQRQSQRSVFLSTRSGLKHPLFIHL